jgi:hypothetical protein
MSSRHLSGLVRLVGVMAAFGGCSNSAQGGSEGSDERLVDDGVLKEEEREEEKLIIEEEEEEEFRNDCERELRLATVSVQAPEAFDVIIVADHSDSLSWSRDDLAAGLETLLSEVQGHEARFFILTPTQYGASSELSQSPYNGQYPVVWQSPADLSAYEDAMTVYSQTCWDDGLNEIPCLAVQDEKTFNFTLEGHWDFVMPDPVAAITPQMNEAQLLAQRTAVSDAILALGLGGSLDEQPVCTLQRYMTQNVEALPENVVFLVITDEDDTSDPARCVTAQQNTITVDADYRVFEMKGSGHRAQRRYQCTPVDDQGNLVGEPKSQLYNIGDCTAPRDCTASDISASQAECPLDHVVSDCTVTCELGEYMSCNVEEAAGITDACNSPFTVSGQNYQNLLDYCEQTKPGAESWGACTNYERDGFLHQDLRVIPLTNDSRVGDMITSFRAKADQAFGSDGYSVELITFQPFFSCTPQAGQSHAVGLSTLADAEDHIFPICGDYAGALSQVSDFAGQLIRTEYAIELSENEELQEVRLLGADNVARSLSEGEYSFDPLTGRLTLNPSAIRADDRSIDVDVLYDCVIR